MHPSAEFMRVQLFISSFPREDPQTEPRLQIPPRKKLERNSPKAGSSSDAFVTVTWLSDFFGNRTLFSIGSGVSLSRATDTTFKGLMNNAWQPEKLQAGKLKMSLQSLAVQAEFSCDHGRQLSYRPSSQRLSVLCLKGTPHLP